MSNSGSAFLKYSYEYFWKHFVKYPHEYLLVYFLNYSYWLLEYFQDDVLVSRTHTLSQYL